MTCGVFELFKIGVGPSSSHTMGPMVATARFVRDLDAAGRLPAVTRVVVDLFGSLALTGRGHATDRALLLGLSGFEPERLDPAEAAGAVDAIRTSGTLALGGRHPIAFDETRDVRLLGFQRLLFHSNALRCVATDADGAELAARTYYSVGGGLVLDEDEALANAPVGGLAHPSHPFASAAELLGLCEARGLSIAGLAFENEAAHAPADEVVERLDAIVAAMAACVERGMAGTGLLPGGLKVRRRAAAIHARLIAERDGPADPLEVLDWVNLWALAVNEENAAGGRVVTAPTNGAAGIVPAVLGYYTRFVPGADADGQRRFLLVAGVVGSLFKENASISGAEVGCQGEVGVACSMAAAGLAAVMGGTNAQVENAAEIAMEHNLGLTCDPVGGLVQVPCIERNAVGAVKAIEAARLALLGDGTHRVSLDQVIETMKRTGADMNERYKETALGGLAVNVVEC